jgi:hypothetical protein
MSWANAQTPLGLLLDQFESAREISGTVPLPAWVGEEQRFTTFFDDMRVSVKTGIVRGSNELDDLDRALG